MHRFGTMAKPKGARAPLRSLNGRMNVILKKKERKIFFLTVSSSLMVIISKRYPYLLFCFILSFALAQHQVHGSGRVAQVREGKVSAME